MRATLAILVLGLLLAAGPACSLGAPAPGPAAAEPSPTLLPPPQPITAPEAAASPAASPSPAALATPIPAPNPASAGPAALAPERVRVANTGGDGANMRVEPAPSASVIRSIKDGTELEVIGADQDAGGRRWRNVRDPSGGVSGWIASDFLVAVTPPSAPPAAAAPPPASPPVAQAPNPSPAAAAPASKPAASAPAPAASPTGSGQAGPAPRITDADRTYLSALQPQVDALGKGITTANEQIERAGGRPDVVSDPGWRQDTQAVAQVLADAAARIRAAAPGPNTGEVNRHALSAADRADAVASALNSTLATGDARNLNVVRTELVRLLAEINNMNLSLLDLQ